MKPFNICIIRPPGYIFSSVFIELAELIAYSLDDNGYSSQITENYLRPNEQNLIIGCHLTDISLTPQIPRGTIILNTEQIGAGPNECNKRVLHFLKNFPSWDYSLENIAKLNELGITTTKHFKIGYHSRLNRIPSDSNKDIDVLFYGALTETRSAILDELEKQGARVTRLFGVFGRERDAYISRSKIVLNLHQHETKIFEIVRAHYLMNNKKAIVSQFDEDTKIDSDYRSGLILAPHDKIVDKCIATIESDELLKACEQKSLETIIKIDSVKIVRELISY